MLLETELKGGCKDVRKKAHQFQLLHFRVESLLQTLEFLYVTQLSALHIIPYLSGMIFVTRSSLQTMAHTYGLCSIDYEVYKLREKARTHILACPDLSLYVRAPVLHLLKQRPVHRISSASDHQTSEFPEL
jgi:hypothetical protein